MSPFRTIRPLLGAASLALAALGTVSCGRDPAASEALANVLAVPQVMDDLLSSTDSAPLTNALRVVAQHDPRAAGRILDDAFARRLDAISDALSSEGRVDDALVDEYARLLAIAYSVMKEPALSEDAALELGDAATARATEALLRIRNKPVDERLRSFRKWAKQAGGDRPEIESGLPGFYLQILSDLYHLARDPGGKKYYGVDVKYVREHELFMDHVQERFMVLCIRAGDCRN